MFEEFANVFGITIGLGMILLPYLFQQAGIVLSTLILSISAILLVPIAFIMNDLMEITGKDANGAVSEFIKKKWLVSLSLTLFTYGALTAYIIAAGDQLFAWLGGDARYWSAIFFVFAVIPFLTNYKISNRIQLYLTTLLFFFLISLIPVNALHAGIAIPAFSSISYIPALFAVSIFALFGHTSIGDLRKTAGKKAIRIFFIAYVISFIVYVIYSITASSAIPNIGMISTASLLALYSPYIQFLLSLLAVFAFYTSFFSISIEWIKSFEHYPRSAIYALLFFPVALLYLAVRRFHILSVIDLVAKIGAFGILAYIVLACLAHYRASKKHRTSLPGFVSLSLSILFLFLTLACFF